MVRLKLNKEQIAAIEHKEGPLLIIAGAGTGKTTVITERIKYLIEKKLALPSEILALTFTEKAAREMEERVDIALPLGYSNLWISTFHSFCDRVLRAEALNIGLDPRYRLMTQAESIKFIRDNLFEFDLDYYRPLGNPTKFVGGLLTHFSRLQDENITPADYIEWAKKLSGKTDEQKLDKKRFKELSNAYRKYDELKVKTGKLDFGDLIVKTLKLFKDRPNILENYQNQFKYILVDEFQDTNFAQNELSIMLAGESANITVVGDDDQAIYRFRGAAISNILQFRKTYKKSKAVVLTKNYRSKKKILDSAYELIQNNNPDRLEIKENINKKLEALKGVGGSVELIHEDRVENEAEAVALKIEELSKRYKYSDFAILVRANNHADPFVRALGRHGIPAQFLGPGRLFRQEEVIDLISYLKVLYDFTDSVSFYRLLSIDNFGVDSRELVYLGIQAKKKNLSLFEFCEDIESAEKISKKTKKAIKEIVDVVHKHLKLIKKETAGQILYYFLEEIGLLVELLNAESESAQKRAKNISKLFDKLKTFEVDNEDATIEAVVDWIELSMDIGESPLAADSDWTEINAVNILTTHSSKGLEFSVVFIVNLVSLRFPSTERREQVPIPDALIKEDLPEGDYHLEEERRLFYVGMTRAKEKLFLTAADYYGEGKREKKLSPFIFESLGDEATSAERTNKISFLDYENHEPDIKENAKQFRIDYLSHSQIETFKTCPLHYKLRYILRIPTPTSPALGMGSSMHAALQYFYTGVNSGEKPSEKYLLETLSANWIDEGYKSKSHEKKSFEKARKFLKEYYKHEFDPKINSISFEQSFAVNLKGKRPLKIGGKIDRIDDLGDGKIEIVDYKTGANVPTQREVDHDMQLTFYALAATRSKDYPFDRKPEDVVLTLYYFDGQKKISTKRTEEDLKKAEEEILKIRDEMEKSDFSCNGNYFCSNCEFKILCNTN